MNPKTVGLLLDSLYNPYEAQLWKDIVKLCREKGLNLTCFAAGKLEEGYRLNSNSELLYPMINPDNLDGLITFSNTLSANITSRGFAEFLNSLSPLPVVSIGAHIEGTPSVVVANEAGMEMVMRHLIEVHSYDKLAFIRGSEKNPEAVIRFETYKKMLDEYNIPLDEGLIVSGNFLKETGTRAVEILLDERGVRFDAVVGANDNIALSAMREFKKRGYNVPEDIAVTGFDDILESRCGVQPLTTIRQPVFEIARSSLELLLSQLYGKRVPGKIVLPVDLKIRRSCGCYLHSEDPREPGNREGKRTWAMGGMVSRGAAESPEDENRLLISFLTEQMEKFFQGNKIESQITSWAEDIILSISRTLSDYNNEKSFFLILENIILQSLKNGIDTLQWYPVISVMFEEFRKHSTPGEVRKEYEQSYERLDVLWKKSLLVIGNIADYRFIHSIIDYKELYQRLQTISEAFINVVDINQLTDVIAAQFQELNIRRFFLVQHHGGDPPCGKLLMGFTDEENFTNITEHEKYPVDRIIPEALASRSEGKANLIYALNFPGIRFGYVVYGITTDEAALFESITMFLNNSLHGANFVNKARQQTLELETKAKIQNDVLESTNQKLLTAREEKEKTLELLKQKEKEIAKLLKELELTSRLDNLTNLYNREALFEFLVKEVNRTKRNLWRINKEDYMGSRRDVEVPSGKLRDHICFFSLIILVVDGFDAILEEFGAQFADIVMVSVSREFKKPGVFRKEDIPGLYENNKFIIILPNTNPGNAYNVAERVSGVLKEIQFENNVRITTSIGIAGYEPSIKNHHQVIANAETALAHARRLEGDRIVNYCDIK